MTTWLVTLTDQDFSVLAQKFGRPMEQVKVIILENCEGVSRQ